MTSGGIKSENVERISNNGGQLAGHKKAQGREGSGQLERC